MIAIDPGLGGTGWAEWTDGWRPTRCGVFTPSQDTSLTLAERANEIGLALRALICAMGPLRKSTTVFLEMPQAMPNSRAGIAAQSGAVYKLTFTTGAIAAHLYPATVHEVQPMKWKGQLPKAIINRRVINVLGTETCERLNIRSHAYDAVGLGLWALGRL